MACKINYHGQWIYEFKYKSIDAFNNQLCVIIHSMDPGKMFVSYHIRIAVNFEDPDHPLDTQNCIMYCLDILSN